MLAGREFRKLYALELFRRGLSPRILLSVARFEIRPFSKLALPVPLDLLGLASRVPPPERHYFVEFEGRKVSAELVRPRRFGTLTEMASLACWLIAHPRIQSVMLISSAIHLRRVKMCCQALLPAGTEIALIAAPVAFSQRIEEGRSIPVESTFAVVSELFKVALYWLLLRLRSTKILQGEQ